MECTTAELAAVSAQAGIAIAPARTAPNKIFPLNFTLTSILLDMRLRRIAASWCWVDQGSTGFIRTSGIFLGPHTGAARPANSAAPKPLGPFGERPPAKA
jgi:hypothetical protein